MAGQNVVIVESPAKAKTINKYLGPDYYVLASYGHVRDLPPKDGSVLPEKDFEMHWQLGERSGKPLGEIRKALKNAQAVYLATDPDREGEAISWHIQEILKEDKGFGKLPMHRVTFNEITKSAIQKAFSEPRRLDTHLVEAYLARRALDYLVGFSISPVLWRKLPGSRSAGRVQSVALRLICDREAEIEKFKADEYWSIHVRLHNPDGAPFSARLTWLAGNKLEKLSIGSEAQAKAAVARIQQKSLSVQSVEKKQVRRFPAAPFITSTLQQEASRKLGIGASQTMRLAQQLYEGVDIGGETVGLITYMRTDGTTLSGEAVTQCRDVIKKHYGDQYVPESPRLYKSKAKNAQEAHEAIRPTDLSRRPEDVTRYLDEKQAKLYTLIWKRTVASQMENAVLDQVTADISDGTDDVILRATGSTIAFDGFLTLYQEDHDDKTAEGDEDDENRRLPPLKQGDATKQVGIDPQQHFTQPPPRYSEASLVKKMEELGIGRPSTYASIIQILQDRQYVVIDKRRFVPEDRGRLVTTFLSKFFTRYVDYEFTANLENELDAISAGDTYWKDALKDFWRDFSKAVDETKGLTITQVIDDLDAELGDHFFPPSTDGKDPRLCPTCNAGRLSLKLGKFGAFIGCSNYPDCRYTRPLVVPAAGEEGQDSAADTLANEPKILGEDPVSGRTVSLRRGPYGPYVQIDPPPATEQTAPEPVEETGKGKKKDKKPAAEKPKRQGLPRGMKPEDVTLEGALKLLSLPRDIGAHPETGEKIQAGIGRFGPYLVHQGKFSNIPAGDDVLTIGINRAVTLIAEAEERRAKREAEGKPARGFGRKAKAKDAAGEEKPAKKTAPKKKAAKKPAAKKAAVKKTAKG